MYDVIRQANHQPFLPVLIHFATVRFFAKHPNPKNIFPIPTKPY
jgi:hypothetical protein